jgi:hypothetical protein
MDVLNEPEYVISIDKIVSAASTMANFLSATTCSYLVHHENSNLMELERFTDFFIKALKIHRPRPSLNPRTLVQWQAL